MDANSVDQIYQVFANHGPAIQQVMMVEALYLFGALMVIEITWSIGKALAHKTDILDIIFMTVNHLIVAGFFLFLLQNWAVFAKNITDSFAILGGNVSAALGGTATMMPVGMIMAGANVAKHVWAAMSISSPLLGLLLLINGAVSILVFGYFAALMVEVLIECFLASYVGIIMMAFGGSIYTRDMAVAQARYAISIGVKRLTMQIIAGLSEAIVNGWATKAAAHTATYSWLDCALMLAVPVVILRLAIRMPNIAQDVVNGAHLNSQGNLFTTASAIAKAAEATAIAVTGAAAAVTAGAAMASKQMGASMEAGTAPSTRVGQAAKMSGMAIAETGKALASDVGKRLTGNYSSQHGSLGWRVASNLSQKANDV